MLGLRLQDIAGGVVFSKGDTGSRNETAAAAQTVAGGATIARTDRLDSRSKKTGQARVTAILVQLPLVAGSPARTVGGPWLYLSYERISHNAASGLGYLYRNLVLSLSLLWLILEVTEAALLADPPRATLSLEAASARGVRISMDDLGKICSGRVATRRRVRNG